MNIIARALHRITRRDPDAPARLPSPDALTFLTAPNGESEAQLLKDILQDAGIRSLLKNRDPVSARAGGVGPPWAYELWVLRKDLARAREIIGTPAPDSDDEEDSA